MAPLVKLTDNWKVDNIRRLNYFDVFAPANLDIIETNCLDDYESQFYIRNHRNYVGMSESKGPVIISVTEGRMGGGSGKPKSPTKDSDETKQEDVDVGKPRGYRVLIRYGEVRI